MEQKINVYIKFFQTKYVFHSTMMQELFDIKICEVIINYIIDNVSCRLLVYR